MDGKAWWAAVHGVARSRTRLSDFTLFFHFHALEKAMATHSSVLAWRIPGTGEPGGLPSMGSHRVGHDWSDLAATAAGQATNKIQTSPHQATSWFFSSNSAGQKGVTGYILSEEREKTSKQEYPIPQGSLIQSWQRNQKLYREAKDQRIQHHQTNFRTNAKGTSIGKKEKKRGHNQKQENHKL